MHSMLQFSTSAQNFKCAHLHYRYMMIMRISKYKPLVVLCVNFYQQKGDITIVYILPSRIVSYLCDQRLRVENLFLLLLR